MKGIFVVIDGLGDLPNKQLMDMTPLEAADMPNIDFFAARGEMGLLYPVKQRFIPESDESLLSIFSNNLVFSTRGYLEAVGVGFEMTRGDLALRANFATIDSISAGNLLDRRAGRTLTGKEIEILSKDINKINLSPKFFFQPTVQHQAVLILKGGFSDNQYLVGLIKVQYREELSSLASRSRLGGSYKSVLDITHKLFSTTLHQSIFNN